MPTRRKIALGAVVVIILMAPAAYFITHRPGVSEAAWFDESWGFRKAIQVTNNSTAESNVYIGVSVESSDTSRFQTDCGDIRFTNQSGELLPYYIASGCGSTASVHVNFNTFPAGQQTIYLYYGNPSAENGFNATDFATQASNYTVGTPGSEEKANGPVAYWKFDEGVGSSANNSGSGGSGLAGIFGAGNSAPTWMTEDMCVAGKCLKFDGSNDYIAIGGTAATVNTIAFWMKPSSTATSYITLNSSAAITSNGGAITTTGITSPTIYINGVATSAFSANTWQHVEITTGTAINANSITIGKSGSVYTNGFLDEIKLYAYARTAAQVKLDYSSGSAAVLGASKDNNDALSDGLVGYWKMDETSGTSAIDSSGNANTGTLGAGDSAPTWASGMYGNGATFDGSNDYIAVGTSGMSAANGTISVWTKANGLGTDNTYAFIYCHRITEGDATRIYLWRNNTNRHFYIGLGNSYNEDTGYTLNDSQWYHLTLTWSGANYYAYVNGVLVKSGATSQPTSLANYALIGSYFSVTQHYQGVVDEFRIYNRTLSPAEVATLYNWAPGPVAYWDLNEKTGSTAYDRSGNNLNAVLGEGNPSYTPSWSTGKIGGALSFDGANDYIQVSNNSLLRPSNDITLSTWLYMDTLPSIKGEAEMLLFNAHSDDPWFSYQFYIDTDNIAYLVWVNSAGTQYTLPCDTVLAANSWYHLAVTKSGATMKCYLNGVDDTGTVAVAPTGTIYPSDEVLIIGAVGSSQKRVDGRMDDVKIYNYARSSKQIVEDMNGGHPTGGSPIASQVGYWNMDEGYGSTVHNVGYGGSGLSGTLGAGNSSPTWSNDGKINKALSFDGSNDYVGVGGTIGNIQTVTFWINPGSTATCFIGLNSTAAISGVAGGLRANGFSAPTYYVNGIASSAFSANTWQHIAVITNQAVNGNLIKIGVSGTNYFNGLMDEVKIYSGALTAEEIKLDYNAGSALVLGSFSNNSGSTAPILASAQEYCIPGDTTACAPPVAEWKMDEKTGTTLFDSSGNGNTGTFGPGNTAPTWTTGKIGSGVKFDGNDYISIGSSNPSSGTTSMWFKTFSLPGTNTYLISNSDTSGRNYIFIRSGNLYIRMGTSAEVAVAALTANRWYHVALMWDNGNYAVYLNGIFEASGSYTGSMASGYDYLGSFNNAQEYFNGIIDQVKVYYYPRSAAQIAWDYNRGEPVGYWRLDECQGTIAYDSSGVGNTGLISIGAGGTNVSVGTCSSAAVNTAWSNGSSGKYSGSLHLGGVDDYVGIGGTINNTRAMSFWVKPFSTTQKIAQLGASDSIELVSGTVTVTGFGTETVYVDGRLSTTIPDTNWHLITVVSSSDITANLIYLGRVSTNYYNGQIDEARIYNYALTEQQVKALYNNNSAIKFGD